VAKPRSENHNSLFKEDGLRSETQVELPFGGILTASKRVEPVMARFLDYCGTARGLSSHTRRAYESDLRDISKIDLDTGTICDVSKIQIIEYVRMMRQRGLRETTVKRRIATAKVLFAWLEREGLVDRSVFHGLDLSIRLPKRLPRALETREMQLLLRACETESTDGSRRLRFEHRVVQAAVLIMFVTGLRVSELVSLKVGDFSVNEGALLVHGKGNRERRVYLPSSMAMRILKAFLAARLKIAEPNHLLITPKGGPVTTQWIRTRLAALGKRGGLARRVTPHMLRHTAATQLLEAGVDIRYVQRLLGHSSIATTQIYTQVSDSSLRDHLERADTFSRVRRAQ